MSSALMLLALFSVQDRTEFAVGDWTRFAGREFGGVVLQESTDSDLKKRFRTERGAFRPEGLVLASRDARVEALLDGRGGQARAIGLWIDFRGRGPSVRETLEGMAEPGALRYPRSRYSDWSVHTFAERGLAVFTVEDRVDVALLTTPDRLKRLSEALQGEPSRIDDLQVWFDRLDPTVRIGDVDVNITSRNITIRDRDGDERELERLVDRRFETRWIRGGRGNGRLSITVDIDHKKVSLSGTLSGENERGKISVSDSSREEFYERNDVPYYRRDDMETWVMRLLRDLVDQAEDSVRAQRPPTEEDERKSAQRELANRFVR